MNQKFNRKELLNIAIKAALHAGQEILRVYNTAFDISYKDDNSPLTMADKRAHDVIKGYLSITEIPILSEEGNKVSYAVRKNWDSLWIVDPLDGTKEFIKRNGEFTVNIALVKDGEPVSGVIYCPVSKELYFGDSELGGSYKYNLVNMDSEQDINIRNVLEGAKKLPIRGKNINLTVAASRSHMNCETSDYIEKLRKENGNLDFISRGSSLKLCMIAEGLADIYPRCAPTYEWDIAAGQAIVAFSGGQIVELKSRRPLRYNKGNLLNPWFIASRMKND
nr:3'(2'),5'-bisphosphate nucleotidase CysQ [Bacteroidota bacterium]